MRFRCEHLTGLAALRPIGWLCLTSLAALALTLLASCRTCPPSPAGDPPPLEGTVPLAAIQLTTSYEQAVARQNERLKRLQFLDSRGVVELRFVENDSEHFEQCDLRLYAVLPSKSALQLSKLGSRYAWIGSDEERWWVFRMDRTPTTLEIQPWTDKRHMDDDGADGRTGVSVVSPLTMLFLSGLTAFPDPSLVTLSESRGALVAESKSARWTLDRTTSLPLRIELLDDAGRAFASGVLSDYGSAPADNLAPGDFAKVAHRVIVTRGDGSGSIKLALDSVSARSDGVKPRFFDLKELQAAMRPDETIWREAATTLERP